MKKVLAILLALSLALGCGLSGLAEVIEWYNSGEEVDPQKATFTLYEPQGFYNVTITYIDPEWEVSYYWDTDAMAFVAEVYLSNENNGVTLKNNSANAVYYNVYALTGTGDYTAEQLEALGLSLEFTPGIGETGGKALIPGDDISYKPTVLSSTGTAVDRSVLDGISWSEEGEEYYFTWTLATINIMLYTSPQNIL